MVCLFCKKKCIKKGKANQIQRYQCSCCKKYQQPGYTKPRIPSDKHGWVIRLNNEGCSISSMARLLRMAKSSVQRIILRLAAAPSPSPINEKGQCYEVDELRTYIGCKANECWVCYAINRASRQVIALCIGRRTKENLYNVIAPLLALNPKRIYTDGLNIYATLIPKVAHRVFASCTNHIERKNLTLRTHLKRLGRRTLCFSRSAAMLSASLRLYLWSGLEK